MLPYNITNRKKGDPQRLQTASCRQGIEGSLGRYRYQWLYHAVWYLNDEFAVTKITRVHHDIS